MRPDRGLFDKQYLLYTFLECRLPNLDLEIIFFFVLLALRTSSCWSRVSSRQKLFQFCPLIGRRQTLSWNISLLDEEGTKQMPFWEYHLISQKSEKHPENIDIIKLLLCLWIKYMMAPSVVLISKARCCSTNTFVINWFGPSAFSSHSFTALPRPNG